MDINPRIISSLKKEGFIAKLNKSTDMPLETKISMVCVQTPIHNKKINLEYVHQAIYALANRLKSTPDYHLIVMRSTVPIGTCASLIKIIESKSGKKIGTNFGFCMNPEFLREKNSILDAMNPRLILIGQHDDRSGQYLKKIYKEFKCPKFIITMEEAEMQKYIHNTFNALKISFYNEMRDICKDNKLGYEKIFQIVSLSSEGMWNPNYGIKTMAKWGECAYPKILLRLRNG